MSLIGLGAFLCMLGGSAINAAAQEVQGYNCTMTLDNGVIVRRNRKSQPVINGEVCKRIDMCDEWGHNHIKYVGTRSGVVYYDSWNKKLMEINEKNEKARQEAIKEGLYWYKRYDYRWRCEFATELKSGKSIAILENRDKDLGYCRVYYIDENYCNLASIGKSPDFNYRLVSSNMSRRFYYYTNDWGRIISKEEYDAIRYNNRTDDFSFCCGFTSMTFDCTIWHDYRKALWTDKDPVYCKAAGIEYKGE